MQGVLNNRPLVKFPCSLNSWRDKRKAQKRAEMLSSTFTCVIRRSAIRSDEDVVCTYGKPGKISIPSTPSFRLQSLRSSTGNGPHPAYHQTTEPSPERRRSAEKTSRLITSPKRSADAAYSLGQATTTSAPSPAPAVSSSSPFPPAPPGAFATKPCA
jgi:hypothetical protein